MSKKYYQMRDVAKILDIPATTIRFWEDTFPQLKPSRSSGGHRNYDHLQLEKLQYIKKLLKEEGLTIEGAKKRLTAEKQGKASPAASAAANIPADGIQCSASIEYTDSMGDTEFSPVLCHPELLKKIKGELREILIILGRRL
jgi:DNA-binding transcriptional MerR regulator